LSEKRKKNTKVSKEGKRQFNVDQSLKVTPLYVTNPQRGELRGPKLRGKGRQELKSSRKKISHKFKSGGWKGDLGGSPDSKKDLKNRGKKLPLPH